MTGETDNAGNVIVPWDLMTRFLNGAFAACGVPAGEAEICADVLIESDRRGIESHGINRFKPIYYDRIKAGIQNPVTDYVIVKKTPTTAVADANNGMGQVAGVKSMSLAVEMAKRFGMGMVAVRNSTHYGIAGYYASMATREGCIGITGTNARPSVAPTFGVENMLGTNPLTIGLPTDEDFPFLIDFATSVTQRGKIEYYERCGLPVPPGQVTDRDGRNMTDPAEILKALTENKAALAPLGGAGEESGGYKGYGYATAVEILSAALAAGSYMKMLAGPKDGDKTPFRLGHFFIAVDTNAFEGEESFRKTAGDICRALRASEKAKGHERIYTAGEKEWCNWLRRKDSGVPVNPALQKELITVRDELRLTQYVFPFEPAGR